MRRVFWPYFMKCHPYCGTVFIWLWLYKNAAVVLFELCWSRWWTWWWEWSCCYFLSQCLMIIMSGEWLLENIIMNKEHWCRPGVQPQAKVLCARINHSDFSSKITLIKYFLILEQFYHSNKAGSIKQYLITISVFSSLIHWFLISALLWPMIIYIGWSKKVTAIFDQTKPNHCIWPIRTHYNFVSTNDHICRINSCSLVQRPSTITILYMIIDFLKSLSSSGF